MFYIDPLEPEIVMARQEHLKNIKCFINKKIAGPVCAVPNCIICISQITSVPITPNLRTFLLNNNNLEVIISGNPQELLDVNKRFWNVLIPHFTMNNWDNYLNANTNDIVNIKKSIEKIFSYKDWFCNKESKYYSAYDLAKKLNRNSCTYCNRIYTSTIINRRGKKIIRTTLDHWFPKTDFPLLSLSFFNLIPSCSNCNSSVKGSTNFNLNDHIHPYVDVNQNEEFCFNYKYNSSLTNYRIYLQDINSLNSKARNTLTGMFIDEMYNSHQSELIDLIKIKTNYSKSYIESIEKLFGNKLAKEEVYRILFGVEFASKDFQKLPLSKFKNDILKKLNIIK
ncbi:hypothetical protein [Flavobacterium adhaerens]|uniref:hypothetical protein n=1 Tax=Flavobacterium adhaerens TaxID=3149043 RepID=UPI0032B32B03